MENWDFLGGEKTKSAVNQKSTGMGIPSNQREYIKKILKRLKKKILPVFYADRYHEKLKILIFFGLKQKNEALNPKKYKNGTPPKITPKI